jgi:hypothetical protein
MAALIPAVEWLAWRCSWSNNKAVWVNTPAADGRGMTCEEDMVKQVEMIKATHPDKRVCLSKYRERLPVDDLDPQASGRPSF